MASNDNRQQKADSSSADDFKDQLDRIDVTIDRYSDERGAKPVRSYQQWLSLISTRSDRLAVSSR